METTPTNFDLALTKGEYAEGIVRLIFERRGYIIYQPTTKGAHSFDMLAIKNKSKCIALDVKAKGRRNDYPDTGINVAHYQTYLSFAKKHNLEFWLVFVDEMQGVIYGNELDSLNYPTTEQGKWSSIDYPLIQNGIRYFPLSNMIQLSKINEEDRSKLMAYNQRNHKYKPIV